MGILIVYGMYNLKKYMIAHKDAMRINRDYRFKHCKIVDNKHYEKC